MNFIKIVNENKEGLVFIDRLRNTIHGICSDGIKEEFDSVTDDDIEKMYLMIEANVIDVISEEDLDNLTLDEVKIMINGMIGIHHLLNGVEKNRRESYKNIMWDVLYRIFMSIDDEEEMFKYSYIIGKVYETMVLEEQEIDSLSSGFGYEKFDESELHRCLSDVYKFMLKDKIDF